MPRVHVIAHPAAIALALFLRRLQCHDPMRRAVVQIFAPASEHGTRGVEELQQQTVSLLSFKTLPKAIFDTQAQLQPAGALRRGSPVAARGNRDAHRAPPGHAAGLAGRGRGRAHAVVAADPGAGVSRLQFFRRGWSSKKCRRWKPWKAAWQSDKIEVRGEEFEPPNNVGQAGQGGIAVGAIVPDRNHADACWFWLVADNLRLAAENAVMVARQLV